MKRAIWLQGTRAMKFLQTQEQWEAGRLTQYEAAQIRGICERSFRRYLVKYDEGGMDAANRYHYIRAKVQVRVSCEGTMSIYHGPRLLANYDEQGKLIEPHRGNGTTG